MRKDKIEVYLHLMWTTYNREFLLSPEVEKTLFPLLVSLGERHDARTLALNGVPDHVHWLVKCSSTTLLCDLAKTAKGASSHHVNGILGNFGWRPTYAAYSVSRWDVPMIMNYIRNQKHHHREKTCELRLEPGAYEDDYDD